MSAINRISDSDPNYFEFIQSSTNFISHNYLWLKNNYDFPSDTIKDFERCRSRIWSKDILIILSLSVIWTIIRFFATKYLFKPFARLCRMSEKDVQKYPESAWKFLFYLSTFAGAFYIIFGQTCCNYFNRRSLIWNDFSIDDVLPENVRILYLIEISFYIHSIYAVLCLDEWRKDSLVMFAHHIITLSLLTLSLATKAHRVGILVLLLHDGCDVIMEATKCLLGLKTMGGLVGKLVDVLSGIGFLLFLSSWAVCRLYWFPLKAIYSCSEYFLQNQMKFPFMLVLYSMLWIILVMDVYWFTFIVKILVNIITGKSKIEDNREYSKNSVNGVHKKFKRKRI